MHFHSLSFGSCLGIWTTSWRRGWTAIASEHCRINGSIGRKCCEILWICFFQTSWWSFLDFFGGVEFNRNLVRQMKQTTGKWEPCQFTEVPWSVVMAVSTIFCRKCYQTSGWMRQEHMMHLFSSGAQSVCPTALACQRHKWNWLENQMLLTLKSLVGKHILKFLPIWFFSNDTPCFQSVSEKHVAAWSGRRKRGRGRVCHEVSLLFMCFADVLVDWSKHCISWWRSWNTISINDEHTGWKIGRQWVT